MLSVGMKASGINKVQGQQIAQIHYISPSGHFKPHASDLKQLEAQSCERPTNPSLSS